MGTEDIEQQFGSGHDWSDWNKQEGNAAVELADYIEWDGSGVEAVYKLGVNRTTPSEAFRIFTLSLIISGNNSANMHGAHLYIKIGSIWYALILNEDSNLDTPTMDKRITAPALEGNACDQDFLHTANLTNAKWHWIGMRFNVDNTIDVGYAPAHWDLADLSTALAIDPKTAVINYQDSGEVWSAGLISEIVLKAEFRAVHASDHIRIAKILVEADAGTPAGGGTATIANFLTAQVTKGISGISTASIKINEAFLSGLAQHQGNHGKYVDLYTNYGYHIIKGEIRIPTMQGNQVNYVLYPYESKMKDLMCNYNPILNTNAVPVVIRNLDYAFIALANKLNDKDYIFEAGWSAYYTVIEQSSPLSLTYHPDFDKYDLLEYDFGLDDWAVEAADDTDGDMGYTYYMDELEANNTFSIEMNSSLLTLNKAGVATYINIFVSSAGIIDKITISGVVSFRKFSNYIGVDKPSIFIYNNVSGLWELLKEFEASDVGGSVWNEQDDDAFGNNQCPNIIFSLPFEKDSYTPYLNYEADGQGDINQYTFKVMVGSGEASALVKNTVHIHKLVVDIDLNTAQYIETGAGDVQTSDNTNKWLSFSTTEAWITHTPSQQGACSGDLLYIVDNLDGFITAVNLVMDGDYTFDIDITNSDRILIMQDFTDKNQYQLAEHIKDLCNGVWWVDDTNKKIIIKTVDNLVDSGKIIQASDIIGGKWTVYYQEDSTMIKSKLIVEGADITYSTDLTPDVVLDVLETVIHRDPSIKTQEQAETEVAELKPKYENTHKLLRFPIRINSDWTGVEVGTLVTFQYPSTLVPTLDFSLTNKIMVAKLEWRTTKSGLEFGTLTLKRRF